jgi:hypothetical protein
MPLLPLQTNLKSLKYDGAGPYVSKDINNPPRYNVIGNEVTARVDDLKRISKLLVDTPGLKWTLHQAELNFAYNEKKGFGRKLLNTLGNTAKVIGSTLAQVPVNGTGTHFVIGFGGNEYLKQGGQRSSWLDRFLKTTAGTGGVNGAKSVLNGKNVILDHRGEEGYRPMIDTQFTDEIENIDARPIDIAQSYIKQDGSLLAKETGKVIVDNTGLDGYRTPNEGLDRIDQELKVNIDDTYLRQDGRVIVKGSESLSTDANIPTRLDNDSPGDVIEKFQTPLANLKTEEQVKYDITAARTRDVKDPYQKSVNKLNPQEAEAGTKTPKISATPVDNKLEPYLQSDGAVKQGKDAPKAVANPDFDYGKNVGGANSVENPAVIRDYRQKGSGGATDYTTKSIAAKDQARRDKDKSGTAISRNEEMIPFTFTIVTPDNFGSGAPTLHFWAFLDSLNDNFNATWTGQKYVGRGESFYNYGGFERKASVGFKVAGGNYKELERYYRKLNQLASSTAPTYNSSGTFMRGSYVRVNIGTYFYNQPVLMNSVGMTWELATPWEINYELAPNVSEVPHVLSVNLDMTVIHDFTPTYATKGEEYFGFKR